MQWCSCDYGGNYSYGVSNIDNNPDAPPRCFSCGNRINNETIIMLLLKETIELKESIRILEEDKIKRDNDKLEEQMEEQREIDNMDRGSDRFSILDL